MKGVSIFGIIIAVLVLSVMEYYSFSALKFAVRNSKPNIRTMIVVVYILLTIFWFLFLLSFPIMRTAEMNLTLKSFVVSFAIGFLLAKLMIAALLLLDDLRKVFFSLFSSFAVKSEIHLPAPKGMSRSDFFNSVALILGGTLFASVFYGMRNRYNYKLRKHTLHFEQLPDSFKGLKAIQISDIHSGSFTDHNAVRRGVELINRQKPDIIFFTGDLVNSRSIEMNHYIDLFKDLKAPMGVFSILGNHDYGDYATWNSPKDKEDNLNLLKKIHQNLGWNLLLDEHVVLEKNSEKIALIGVQNISFNKSFHTYGDLKKAYEGSESYPFKILLTHDPTHWDGEVNSHYKDINLTLSGHTHGFQFGVEIPGFKWSPAEYIYKQWAGLYQEGNQFLYVNRGFGFLGYPGRVGILPEITLFEFV